MCEVIRLSDYRRRKARFDLVLIPVAAMWAIGIVAWAAIAAIYWETK